MNIEKNSFVKLGLVLLALNFGTMKVQAEEDQHFSFRVGCDVHDYIGDGGAHIIESHPYLDVSGKDLPMDSDYTTSIFNLTRRASLTETYQRARGYLNMSFHPGLQQIPLFSGDNLFVSISGSDGQSASSNVTLPVCPTN